MWRKVFSLIITLSLVFQQVGFASMAVELNLAGHLSKMSSGMAVDRFRPVHIRFFSFDMLNDNIKVMLDKGDLKSITKDKLGQSTQELLNYFLIGLTLPNDTFWVNLRPDSENEIIDDWLAKTDVGKIMLEADLQLKKDTARFTSPETTEGRAYWTKLYQKAEELYGYQEVTIPTLTRPWIVPNEIIVRETKDSSYIYKATLKVMLEQDVLSREAGSRYAGKDSVDYSFKDERSQALNEYSSQLIRELILPKLTTEINLSKRYSALRQVYYSLIFSRWFKSRFANQTGKYASLIDRKDLTGLTSISSWTKASFFDAYQKSFSQGEYNVKETVRTPTGQVIRSYFSGGMKLIDMPFNGGTVSSPIANALITAGLVSPEGMNAAASPITVEVRRADDLKEWVKDNKIDSGMIALDWNIKHKDLVDDSKLARIFDSVDAIDEALNKLNLQYLYVMTHLERPQDEKDLKVRFDKFNLGPNVNKVRLILAKKGLKNVEVVALPFDLNEAGNVIREYQAKSDGKKIIFVFENMRFYEQEQLVADKKASFKEKAEVVKIRKAHEERLISLTGRTADKLVYMSEAYDKAHRGQEASMEMAWLFPEQNRIAGPKFAKDIQAVLNFQLRITGSLSAMFGGAKFDKYDAFGKLSEVIAKTKGKLMIVGAQINPFLKAKGIEIGKSLQPTSADQKKVDKGIEAMEKSGVAIILPEDLFIDGKADPVALNSLTTEDVQIDIGDKAIEQDVVYINSLNKGDGLILNGGAGIFDRDGGSKKGTIALVVAANEAAKRGVAVIAAGGDMYNALQMVIQEVPGFELDSTFEVSTGGGSLLEALAKGITNLASVRAVLKMDPTQGLHDIYSAVKDAFPQSVVMNVVTTLAEDSAINGDEANRKALLDPFRSIAGTMNIVIPDGPLDVRPNLIYDGAFMPVTVLAENIPEAIREKIILAKDSTAVSDIVAEYFKQIFTDANVNLNTVTKDKIRSSKLDPAKLGPASVDISALKAVKSENNDILLYVPIWVKRSVAAMDALNEQISADMKEQTPAVAALLEETRKPLAWPKENLVISNPEAAFQTFAQYAPLFFDEFSKGDLSHAKLLQEIFSKLDPKTFLNPEGFTIDELMGDFISTKDKDSKITGIGKNLLAFKSRLNSLQQLAFFSYIVVNAQMDASINTAIPVKDAALQNELVRFYARAYRYLFEVAEGNFKNAGELDGLRDEIGSNVQKLNRVLRNTDALELSTATAKDVINHLTAKGVELNQAEKDNINNVFTHYKNGSFAYDILMLAGLLRESTFASSFRHLALDNPNKVLPSRKPKVNIYGTGQIGSVAIVLRFESDINVQEPGYISEYKFSTTKLNGDTAEEKFKSAVKVAIESFGDPIIKSAGIKIKTENGSMEALNDLLSMGRLEFKASNQVEESRGDFQDPIYVKSVYAVNIVLDGKKVGEINFNDVTQYEAGYREEAKAMGITVVNIPRPLIVRKADGREVYFGLQIDATPGGVNIGNRQLTEAAEQGKPKLDGPPLFRFAGKYDLTSDDSAVEGDAALEYKRLREIAQQTEETRLPKDRKESFIYVKAQIFSKLILPDALGGSINFMGKYLHKIAHIKEYGAMFITPTSCSTNGESYITLALSAFVGKFGLAKITKAGPTYHMYTSGDKKKGQFGDLNEKTTGAAKGVREHLLLEAIYGAMRTPTAYTDGETELKGGSLFYLPMLLPQNIKEELLRKYIARVAAEYPEMLKLFTEADKVNGRYTHENTIFGQRTGSILYEDYINQVIGPMYTMLVGYDNEMSFSFKMQELIEQYLRIRERQKDSVILAQLAPLVNTDPTSASSAVELSVANVMPSQTTTLGSPTVRIDIELKGGAKGHFVLPAGTSTGEDEAKTIMQDFGFEQVVKNVMAVNQEVARRGLSADQVVEIGQVMLEMGKDSLGAETTLSYQMAAAWAAARQQGLEPYEFIRLLAADLASQGVPITKIQYNITNGGQHAANNLDMQEFMVVPIGKTTAEANMMADNIDRHLGLIYQALGLQADPNDQGVGKLRGKEGGYKIEDLTTEKLEDIYKNAEKYNIENLDIRILKNQKIGVHEFVLNCQLAAIKNAGYKPAVSNQAGTVSLALDPAATSMLTEGQDNIYNFEGRQITSKELVGIYASWTKKYPMDSIEDGLGENDWDGFMDLIGAVGDKVMVVTDDITVSQAGRFLKFIEMLKQRGFMGSDGKVTKRVGILIKLNQNGFLTTGINDFAEGYLGTLEVIRLAKKHGIEWVVSHRSKEAEPSENEVSIAELAAGTNAYGLKSGDHIQAIRAVKEDRLAAIDARERAKVSSPLVSAITTEEYNSYVNELQATYVSNLGSNFNSKTIEGLALVIAYKNKPLGSSENIMYRTVVGYTQRVKETYNTGLTGMLIRAALILANETPEAEKAQYVQEFRAMALSNPDSTRMWDRAAAQFILVAINDETREIHIANFKELVAKYSEFTDVGILARAALAMSGRVQEDYIAVLKNAMVNMPKSDTRRAEILLGLVAIANGQGSSPLENKLTHEYIASLVAGKKPVTGNTFRFSGPRDFKEFTLDNWGTASFVEIIPSQDNNVPDKVIFNKRATSSAEWVGFKTFTIFVNPDGRVRTDIHQDFIKGQEREFFVKVMKVFEDIGIGINSREVVEDLLSGNDHSVAASSAVEKRGGIDFRPAAMPITYQAMGNFASLNLDLPKLSQEELARFDVDKELAGLETMVEREILPSGERIKEVLAASSQKGEMEFNRERVMVLLVKAGILEETQCCLQEASTGYKEALVLADSLS
ncbi:MAG: phosphoglycerate kinase [Candidatus Omnitrophota bacterium]